MRSFFALFALLLLVGCDGAFRDPAGDGVSVSICGDGRVTGEEECDDGNDFTEPCAYGATSCTVCDAKCRLVPGATSYCGDGHVDGSAEECDDGNVVTETCSWGERCAICDASCRLVEVWERCGDGVVQAEAGEVCDDGWNNSDRHPDACRTDCTAPRCGDGVVDTGEKCDPGIDRGCGPRCDTQCGDGVIEPGEACDDGSLEIEAIVGGAGGVCLRLDDGEVVCSGAIGSPPDVAFESISIGDRFACGIDANGSASGRIRCWGAVTAAPEGERWRKVAVGSGACAVNENGVVNCWAGLSWEGVSDVRFVDIGVGRGFACGIDETGEIRCWGSRLWSPPEGRFSRSHPIQVGPSYACARRDGTSDDVCWGDERRVGEKLPARLPRAVVLGDGGACGLDSADWIQCWGQVDAPPTGVFRQLAPASSGFCGLDAGRNLVCWGGAAPKLPMNVDGVFGACRTDCTRPRCGDGVVDPGEACDLGGPDPGAGCGDACERVGSCGDGIVQSAFEACDDGDATSGRCEEGTSCTVCSSACTWVEGEPIGCGDGVVDPGEDCDDGTRGPRLLDLDTTPDEVCGILLDGRMRCWRSGWTEPVPEGRFTRVAISESFRCGLDRDGRPHCLGIEVPFALAGATFADIEAGRAGVCGITADGAVACWGEVARVLPGTGWRDVDVGPGDACAVDASGDIECWGSLDRRISGDFRSVAVGPTYLCHVTRSGEAHCDQSAQQKPPPFFSAASVAIESGWTCLLADDGKVRCAGSAWEPPPADRFRTISVGRDWACGIDEAGFATCWGNAAPILRNGDHRSNACRSDCTESRCGDGIEGHGERCDDGERNGTALCPWETPCNVCNATCTGFDWGRVPRCGDGQLDEPFEECDDGPAAHLSVARGDGFTCAEPNGAPIRCWGRDDLGQSSPPAEARGAVVAGARHACASGLNNGAKAVCWGAGDAGQLDVPDGWLSQATAGRDFTCGYLNTGAGRADGWRCWGDRPAGLPSELFDVRSQFLGGGAVSAGDRSLCAVGIDYRLRCWGEDIVATEAPQLGHYQFVALGTHHGCALVADGQAFSPVVCWGDDAHGQATPPPGGRFGWLAAGATRTCGYAVDGWTCWGASSPDMPQDLLEESISLGRWGADFACGILPTGRDLTCWGADVPEATLPPWNGMPGGCTATCERSP